MPHILHAPPCCGREQLNCAKTMYKLSEEKFDMLLPKNIPSAKATAEPNNATKKALDDLKTVISSHLRVSLLTH